MLIWFAFKIIKENTIEKENAILREEKKSNATLIFSTGKFVNINFSCFSYENHVLLNIN
jgi:hypothetical protein